MKSCESLLILERDKISMETSLSCTHTLLFLPAKAALNLKRILQSSQRFLNTETNPREEKQSRLTFQHHRESKGFPRFPQPHCSEKNGFLKPSLPFLYTIHSENHTAFRMKQHKKDTFKVTGFSWPFSLFFAHGTVLCKPLSKTITNFQILWAKQ